MTSTYYGYNYNKPYQKKYRSSAKGKAMERKYNAKPERRAKQNASHRGYMASDKGRAFAERNNARRRARYAAGKLIKSTVTDWLAEARKIAPHFHEGDKPSPFRAAIYSKGKHKSGHRFF